MISVDFKDLKSKLSHNFKEAVAGLILLITKFDVDQLDKATKVCDKIFKLLIIYFCY